MEEFGVLNYVKRVIHSLVVSTPMRVCVEALKRDYKNEEGSDVPFRQLGFKDLESFLRSIPDTVTVIGWGPMAEVQAKMNAKTEHIQMLVKQQKKPSITRKPRGGRGKPRFTYPSTVSNLVFTNECYHSNRRFHYNNNSQNHTYRRNRSPPTNENYNHYARQQPNSPLYSHQKEANSMANSFAKMNIAPVDDESSSDELEMYLPDKKVIDNMQEIKSNSPVLISQPEFKPIGNPSINVLKKSPIVQSPIYYVSSDEDCDDDASSALAEDNLVLNCNATEKKDSIYLDNSKPSVVSFVNKAIEKPFIQYISSGDSDGSDSEAAPLYAVDDRVKGVEYPMGTVRNGYCLPERDFQKKIKLDTRIRVSLVTVGDPHSFYFWLRDEEFDDYKAMSTNMQRFYDDVNDARYTIPLSLIEVGHLAVTKNLTWHRIRVLYVLMGPQKSCEVEYIDTGERRWVDPSKVKYLCKEFATLPPQCWYGRLAYVAPKLGSSFSGEARDLFLNLVSHRCLWAIVEKISEKDNTVYLILVDTAAKSFKVNVNSALVQSGLVRRCSRP